MKILILSSYTVPDFAGGGRNAWQFACYLNSRGIESFIFTLNRNFKNRRKEVIHGIKIFRSAYFTTNNLSRAVSLLFLVWPVYIYKALKSEYIYVVGANIPGYMGFIILSQLMGKKIIFRSSLAGFDDFETLTTHKGIAGKLRRSILSGINTYVSINPYFTDMFINSGLKRVKIIKSSQGVNTGLFEPASESRKRELRVKYAIPDESMVMISVGFIINRKGFDRIFEYLATLDHDFIYVIAGETFYPDDHFMSAYIEETEKLINKGKASLGDKLVLTGPVENAVELFQLADVFILGSRSEGTPNVLLEAMACGLPVMSSRLEGISGNLIHIGKNGYEFTGSESFADGFRQLASSAEFRRGFGEASREIILSNHSFEHFYRNVFLDGQEAI